MTESKQPPDELWLQWNCGEHDQSWGNPNPGDVTWCGDRVFSDDVRYVIDKRYKRKAKKVTTRDGE